MTQLVRVLAFAVTAAVAASPALAGPRDPRSRMTGAVDDAMAAVNATDTQRQQVREAVADVLRTAHDAFGSHPGSSPEMDELLRIFAADKLDTDAIASLRAKRQTRHKQLADAVVEAFAEVHGALSREQRQQLTDYAKGKVQGRHMKAFKTKLMSGFVNAQIEDVLGQMGASESERTGVHSARDQVMHAVEALHAGRDARLDELTRLFRDPAVDRAALSRFRAETESEVNGVVEAIDEAVHALHATLTPAHRQQLVQLIRERRARRANPPHSLAEAF